MVDEATYSQIAKEALLKNSFLTPTWQQQPWFEKPPFIIWLTALSFKLFGVSETSAHLFPGIFGILSSIVLYKIGKELFKDSLAGFFAGFIFLTTPLILLYNRAVMMDIPVGFFISLSALAILKLTSKNKGAWWLVYFGAMGFGVLTKSIIGLLPLTFLVFYAFNKQSLAFLKNKDFYKGFGLFFIIALPWHIYMSLKFGLTFWNDYLGFHIWTRLNSQIFPYPWEDANNFGYLKLLLLRSNL